MTDQHSFLKYFRRPNRRSRSHLAPLLACVLASLALALAQPAPLLAADPDPPTRPVKLIFIHHSCGENWLGDSDGGLGIALRDNGYFVSDTNYGWGPDGIGDNTDIGHWWDWFRGASSATYLSALYAESGRNSTYSRLTTDPGGANAIVMFKSCYPNSHLGGSPGDPASTGDNPLRGEPSWSEYHTVANAKGIYNDLLVTFAANPDKLFVAITAPPLEAGETDAAHAANARALNTWLVNDWLDGYAHTNVAVFDFYNVLTSNGGDADTNDAGAVSGNHHRWWEGAVKHQQTVASDVSAYPGGAGGGSHPTAAGNQKATAEFVSLLNAAYNRWQSASPCVGVTEVTIVGPATGVTGTQVTFGAAITPVEASLPITYEWEPAPDVGQTTAAASYTWPITGSHTLSLTAANCGGVATTSHTMVIRVPVYRRIFLPLVLRGWQSSSPPPATPTPQPISGPVPSDLVAPADLQYVGAFRLPGGEDRPETFAYGGNAMTFSPDGDPGNGDAYPGSLFITGHDRLAYGELPDGGQVAEVSIPVPAIAANAGALSEAAFLQGFHNVAAGYFTDLEEIPKLGMQYLNDPATGPLIHLSWGQHLQPQTAASHAWFSPNLASADLQGAWYIGNQNLYSTNGYMFDIPSAWADAYASGRMLATGRMRDGGQGGMGPALFAYRPWASDGTAPASGTHLPETTLLLYENAYNTAEITRSLQGYQHADEWEGGAWVTTPSGKSAVLFAGTKGTGTKYWYGYIHPGGPQRPCVDDQVADFTTCRLADGTPCPPEDFSGCCDEGVDTCVSGRGWWSTRFDAQLMLYDPADLARVASGEIAAHVPQPYAVVDIDKHLYLDPPVWDEIVLGWGDQRRYRVGAVAYDRQHGLLYVLELYADGAKPVVHVWQLD